MTKVDRRSFLETVAFSTAALALPSRCAKARALARPPNIVVVMADDLGYGDPRCYNPDSRIPTPHIDALATAGTRFTDAHSPSAVCTPTRYGVLTGRYAWRTWLSRGVVGGYTPPLIDPGRTTLATMLKQAGYATGFYGKWHLGVAWTRMNGFVPTSQDGERLWRGSWQDADPATGMNADFTKPVRGGPIDHGFDDAYFTAACSTIDGPFAFIERDRTDGIPNRQVSEFYDMTRGEEGSPRRGWIVPGYRLEEVDLHFTRRAVRFIEQAAARSPTAPFFVSLFLSSPHTPWLPPDFVRGASRDGPRGDLVVLADWCVGQVTAALDRLGLARHTLVIFTSDNGPHPGTNGHLSAGPLRGLKTHIWEGGHRVPFIARWPGHIRPGSVTDELLCLTDLIATFATLAGLTLDDDAGPDSYDLSSVLLDRPGPRRVREVLVSHSENGTFAVRRGHWKLILDNQTSGGWMTPAGKPPQPDTPGQLYNVAEDPYEERNLWAARPDIVRDLAALLERYRKEGRSAPRGGRPVPNVSGHSGTHDA